MESDPYEIWREAMEEIERQRLIDEYEAAEFQGPTAIPGQANPEVLARAWEILLGDEMDEEKEKKASRLISAVLFVRASMIGILVVVFGALTYALMVNKLNGWEFVAACSVWFGLAILFFWGTDIAKKEREDAGE
jgi:hypothetical protein